MPRTLIKSRLHTPKHKPKIEREINNTNSKYLHIFNDLDKNFYHEMVLLYINELGSFSFAR